jgi:flagellar basal-body rod protein FlgF
MISGIKGLADVTNRMMPKLDCITNNIANIHTSGYKAERLHYLRKEVASSDGSKSIDYDPVIKVDHSQGLLQKTGNPLDIAIEGDGYFVIQTKDGDAYSRKGNFTINKNGEIVTPAGDYLQGASGKIAVKGKDVVVGASGEVKVDGSSVGKLKIVTFSKPEALVKLGGGLFSNLGDAGMSIKKDPMIREGHLELSNVEAIKEMVAMINLQRSVEMYQKGIQSVSDQDKLVTTRVGKLI